MLYKNTFKSHIQFIILQVVTGLLLLPYFFHESIKRNNPFIMIFFGGIVVLALLILAYTHIEYFLKNFGMSVKVDDEKSCIEFYNKRKHVVVSFDQISQVQYHKTAAVIYNSRRILLTDNYHYAKIILADNRKFYITSLMSPEFTLPLKDKEVTIKRIIALIATENKVK